MIRILAVLLALSSPCFAQANKPMSFIRHVGEYTFRIPTADFFYQLHVQFCKNAASERCRENLDFLQRDWITLDATFQSLERQHRERPMAYIDIDLYLKRFVELNAQVTRFVESEGMSTTPQEMRPQILGQ